MTGFRHIDPSAIGDNTFGLIGGDWMLVTSANDTGGLACGKDYNTMTASWGGMGVLWGRPVVFVFIRPQRHTFGFTETNDRMTLSFFGDGYRSALSYCGRMSGRDIDKAAQCSLTPSVDHTESGRAVWFEEARLVLKVKKLYADYIRPEAMTDPLPRESYPNADYHRVYVCEITDVLEKDE